MSSGWSPERREAQRQRAIRLHQEGRFGGPGMGQGRKPKRNHLDLATCPHCGGSLWLDTHDEKGTTMDDVTASDSFVVLRDGSIVKLPKHDDDARGVALAEDATPLRRRQAVTVAGRRGVITGFSSDHNHVFVRFGDHAQKVDVDEVEVA
jgi:hypothetical protein